MKFDSRKDILFKVIILGICSFLIGITVFGIIKGEMESEERWILIPIFAVVGFLLWIFYGTKYELTETEFIFRSGPFARKIQVNRIKEIVVRKTLWIGNWPTTARKGLLIKYDTYGLINISPKTNESFIEKILELNRKIKITES